MDNKEPQQEVVIREWKNEFHGKEGYEGINTLRAIATVEQISDDEKIMYVVIGEDTEREDGDWDWTEYAFNEIRWRLTKEEREKLRNFIKVWAEWCKNNNITFLSSF